MFLCVLINSLQKLLDDEDDDPPRKSPHRSRKRKDPPSKGGISESDLDAILAATGQDFTEDDPDFTLTPNVTSPPPEKAPRKDPRRTPRKRKYKGAPPKSEETPEKGGEEPHTSQHDQDLASNQDEQVGTCTSSLASHTNIANAFQPHIPSLARALLLPRSVPPAPPSIASSNDWSLVSEAIRQADVVDEDETSDSYATLLRMVAQYSDVEAKAKDVFKASRLVHLASEDYSPPPDSIAITLTKSIPEFINAWWREFAQKDLAGPEPRQQKWGSAFRIKDTKPTLRPFIPADEVLTVQPLADPPMCYNWLPPPPQRMHFTLHDAKYFEGLVRKSLCAINYVEASLQALPRCVDDDKPAFARILRGLTPAIKVLMRINTSQLCQWVQLRRDHWLEKSIQIPIEHLQQLRHARTLGIRNLFPAPVLDEVNKQCVQNLQCSAFMNLANSSLQLHKKQKTAGNDARSGSQVLPPSFAREPFVVRTGKPLVSPRKRHQRARACPEMTEPVQVRRVLFSSGESYVDRDDLPLASDFQTAEWEVSYTEAVIKAKHHLRTPVGGRLRAYAETWHSIGASRRIIRWLSKGYKLPFLPGMQDEADKLLMQVCPTSLRIHYHDRARHEALHNLVATLLEKDVIEPVPHGTLAFHCLLFLRIKPNGTWRGITDTSKLNEFLRVKPFKMDTSHVIRQALTDKLWAVSVDFSDAYYHIPVHKKHRKYLAFQVGETRYWFKATPFGLSPLPQVFTEIFTTLKAYTRKNFNVMAFQYIDDWLLLSRDRQSLAHTSLRFVNLCTDLGIIVNFDKSELVPTQRLIHLGIDWNFATCQVRPPTATVEKLQHHLRLVITERQASLAMLESIRGKLCSLEKVVPFGRINFRYFQALVTKQLKKGRHPRRISLSNEAITDLSWWNVQDNLLVGSPFVTPAPDVTITSDASTEGWGATFEGRTIAGRWKPEHENRHINWLEMEAVRITLQRNVTRWRGKVLRFLVDNSTTVAYVNKQGGTRSDEMNDLTRQLMNLALKNRITVTAFHLAGERNVVADLLSRKNQVCKNEWQLDANTFQWVQTRSMFGPATVDLFANQLNHQLPRYCSPHHDPNALLVNALVAKWPRDEVLYAFPPTNILELVLARIREQRPPRLILIAPEVPTATWFPSLKRVAARHWQLPASLQLLQPHWDHKYPDPLSARLGMWMIRGSDW